MDENLAKLIIHRHDELSRYRLNIFQLHLKSIEFHPRVVQVKRPSRIYLYISQMCFCIQWYLEDRRRQRGKETGT